MRSIKKEPERVLFLLVHISDMHINKARELVSQNAIDASESDVIEYTYAIAHAMETDAFIGSLYKQLKTDELLEDTVLVFFTDHYVRLPAVTYPRKTIMNDFVISSAFIKIQFDVILSHLHSPQ